MQKQKFKKSTTSTTDLEDSLKNSTISQQQRMVDEEEKQRLENQRIEKFRFIENSMANHKIEEMEAEYVTNSFLSQPNNDRRTTHGRSLLDS